MEIGAGRKVFVECKGAGSLTVVFESGDEDDHRVWSGVVESVSGLARTCTPQPSEQVKRRHGGDTDWDSPSAPSISEISKLLPCLQAAPAARGEYWTSRIA